MKFFRWIFSASQRHYHGIRRYEKGGTGIRIFTLFLMLAFSAAALALEWWSISLLAENFLVGLLAFIFLAVVFCLAAAEFSLVYALVAFRMFFWGVAERAAYRAAKKTRKRTGRAGRTGRCGAGSPRRRPRTGSAQNAPRLRHVPLPVRSCAQHRHHHCVHRMLCRMGVTLL